MQPRSRFAARLGLADVVTATNAALGFLAAAAAPFSPTLAARLVLLAAVADGLDGVLATRLRSTPVGEFLDSLADVASFGVAPALFVFGVARAGWGLSFSNPTQKLLLALAIPGLFVVLAVVRLGFYTAYDIDRADTEGAQTTLAATVLAVGYLAGLTAPAALLAVTLGFVLLMVAPVTYPDLRARDAVAMGSVQVGAIVLPELLWAVFPRVLLVAAVAYLVLAPRFYPRTADEGKPT